MRTSPESSSEKQTLADPARADDLAAVVSQLLDRVRLLEDRAEITTLIASYGPLVDGAAGEKVANLWTPDGRYEVAGFEPWVGREAIARIVDEPQHRDYLEAGCAHVMGTPVITVSGDEAEAVNYTTVFVRQEGAAGWKADGWKADRVSAHRWQLVRTGDGWRVQSRRGQAMDGSVQARSFLADNLEQ